MVEEKGVLQAAKTLIIIETIMGCTHIQGLM